MWTPLPLTAEIARRWIDDGTADQAVEAKQREAEMRLDLLRRRLGPLEPELRVSTRLDMSLSSRSDTDVPKDAWLEKKNGWGVSVPFPTFTLRSRNGTLHEIPRRMRKERRK